MLLMVVLFSACDNNEGDISARYHVLDKNGHETSVFNYGDEMVFELVVTNTTSQALKVEDRLELIGSAFIVYNSEGDMFNPIPSHALILHSETIEPGKQFRNVLIWPWDTVPLPKGKYYSTYTLNFGKKANETYTISFEVK